MTERRVLVGMIHGRFQPFHNGHLEYLRESVERSGAIVVGITNADRGSTRHEETDVHRSAAEANPWTYLERYRMIRGVLAAEGLGDCAVVPFPISDPTLLASYVEPGTTHFIRVFDDWGREKAARLRAHAVAERRGLSHLLPRRLPRLVPLRRCRRHRCGRRRLGDGPYR